MIYGSVRNFSYRFWYLTGDGLSLSQCCAHSGENILTDLKKKKKKGGGELTFNILAKFLTKLSSKMQNLGQSDPYNFFYSLPALNLRQKVFKSHDSTFKNTKFSSFWGRYLLRHPPCASKQAFATMTPNTKSLKKKKKKKKKKSKRLI